MTNGSADGKLRGIGTDRKRVRKESGKWKVGRGKGDLFVFLFSFHSPTPTKKPCPLALSARPFKTFSKAKFISWSMISRLYSIANLRDREGGRHANKLQDSEGIITMVSCYFFNQRFKCLQEKFSAGKFKSVGKLSNHPMATKPEETDTMDGVHP